MQHHCWANLSMSRTVRITLMLLAILAIFTGLSMDDIDAQATTRVTVTAPIAISLLDQDQDLDTNIDKRTDSDTNSHRGSLTGPHRDSTESGTEATTTPPNIIQHSIQPGDNLSTIFQQHGFSQNSLMAVMAADEALLALEVLKPDTKLQFTTSSNGQLEQLTFSPRPGRTIHYQATEDGQFGVTDHVLPSEWSTQLMRGEITNSFYVAAKVAGLKENEILRIQHIFEGKINFRRHIRASDWFEVVLAREHVDQLPTGQSRIDAVLFRNGSRTYQAFLHTDGTYYDQQGHTLSRALRRYPMAGNYRVSSRYNLRRLHPVTKQIRPHYGVDFAMPTGTPILASGDGVVTRVSHHPYAGKYIKIEHPGQFKTRYLHLTKPLSKLANRLNEGNASPSRGIPAAAPVRIYTMNCIKMAIRSTL